MSVFAWIERNTCGIPRRRSSHLGQISDTWKILDTNHEIGGDQEKRSSQCTITWNIPGIRVPKCTQWWPQRIHSETFCQARWRMHGPCSISARESSDDAFDGTVEFESARRDDSVWTCSTIIVQSSCRKIAAHYWSETRFDVRDKMLVIQTCVTYTCGFDTFQESQNICKEHENWISTCRYLHWNKMTWTRPWKTSRDILTLPGLVIQWRGRAHVVHFVTLMNFSWRVNVEDKGLLSYSVENQKCMLLVLCQPNWFSHKPYWKKVDYYSWYTREKQQHSTRSGKETRSKS